MVRLVFFTIHLSENQTLTRETSSEDPAFFSDCGLHRKKPSVVILVLELRDIVGHYANRTGRQTDSCG